MIAAGTKENTKVPTAEETEKGPQMGQCAIFCSSMSGRRETALDPCGEETGPP